MRKLFSILLAAVIMLTLASCQKEMSKADFEKKTDLNAVVYQYWEKKQGWESVSAEDKKKFLDEYETEEAAKAAFDKTVAGLNSMMGGAVK